MQQKSDIAPGNNHVKPSSSRYQIASLISAITQTKLEQACPLTASKDNNTTFEADTKATS